jgi:hypothetical protein
MLDEVSIHRSATSECARIRLGVGYQGIRRKAQKERRG